MVLVIDETVLTPNSRGRAIRDLGRSSSLLGRAGVDSTAGPDRPDVLPAAILIHHNQYAASSDRCRWIEEVSGPKVHYGGGGVRFSDLTDTEQRAKHYAFPYPVDRLSEDVDRVASDIRKVFEWLRDGGHPPEFLVPERLLDPLLPLGILFDGYLACAAKDPAVSAHWFRWAMEAVRARSTPKGKVVESSDYWNELRACSAAVERLERILGDTTRVAEDLRVVLGQGSAEGVTSAAQLYTWACDKFKDAWDRLASESRGESTGAEAPHGEELRRLVENASDGFHVLAAGHL